MPNVCDGVTTSASGTFSWTNNFTRKVRIENAGTSWPLMQQPPIHIGAGLSVAETVLNNATPNDYPYAVYFDDAVNGIACPQDANPKIVVSPGMKDKKY